MSNMESLQRTITNLTTAMRQMDERLDEILAEKTQLEVENSNLKREVLRLQKDLTAASASLAMNNLLKTA